MKRMTDTERDVHIFRLFAQERCSVAELAAFYRVRPVHVLNVVRARAARAAMSVAPRHGKEVVHG